MYSNSHPKIKTLYGIVSEKLTPLSSSTNSDFIRFYALLDYWFDVDIAFPTLEAIEKAEKKEGWPRWCETYNLSDKYLRLFKDWAKSLDARHIRWGDYKAENIMARGGLPVISDLGYSKAPTQRIPTLQVEGV